MEGVVYSCMNQHSDGVRVDVHTRKCMLYTSRYIYRLREDFTGQWTYRIIIIELVWSICLPNCHASPCPIKQLPWASYYYYIPHTFSLGSGSPPRRCIVLPSFYSSERLYNFWMLERRDIRSAIIVACNLTIFSSIVYIMPVPKL